MRLPVACSFVLAGLAACGREEPPAPQAEEAAVSGPRTIDRGEGCTVEVTQEGAGPVAKVGDEVTIAYEGRVKDAEETIASTLGWAAPCRVRLGEGGVVPGLARGIEGLRAGSKARIEVPPALGYGKDGCPTSKVPPDATLVFDVELLAVR